MFREKAHNHNNNHTGHARFLEHLRKLIILHEPLREFGDKWVIFILFEDALRNISTFDLYRDLQKCGERTGPISIHFILHLNAKVVESINKFLNIHKIDIWY